MWYITTSSGKAAAAAVAAQAAEEAVHTPAAADRRMVEAPGNFSPKVQKDKLNKKTLEKRGCESSLFVLLSSS